MATLQQHALVDNVTQRIPAPVKLRPRVIALVRVSDLEQANDDKHGIPRQKTQINNGAKLHDVEIIRWVIVVDVSGKDVMNDEDFQQIFADLRSGAADGVIVAEQSRLVRPGRWSDFGILDIFRDNKRQIWTPSARIDPNTKEGWYILTCGGMISGDELKTLYDRLCRSEARTPRRGQARGRRPHAAQVRSLRPRARSEEPPQNPEQPLRVRAAIGGGQDPPRHRPDRGPSLLGRRRARNRHDGNRPEAVLCRTRF